MPTEPSLYNPAAQVRYGTSSFSSKDWVGPFYPPGTTAGAFLGFYARAFDAVEIDTTYYALPRARLVDGWAEKTPEGFLICAKFPKTIVHGGTAARPDPRRILDADATYEDRDVFLETMRRLGPRLGTLVLQFPYFNRTVFPSLGPFLERLDPFLRDLPTSGLRYAVEVRNRAWVKPELGDVLRRHGASLVLVDQAWMPHGEEVLASMDALTGPECYIRLLGDRKRIEALTTTWDKEVLFHDESMERWARLISGMMKRNVRTLVFVNNHYGGHAPATVRRLRDMVQDEVDDA